MVWETDPNLAGQSPLMRDFTMNKIVSKDASKKSKPHTFHITIVQTGKNTAGIQDGDEANVTLKKEYVRQAEEAKAQETRKRRITKIVEKLSESG